MPHEEWIRLRHAIEGAIRAVQANERGGWRVHTGSAEKMAATLVKHTKGDEKAKAKELEPLVHKSKSQIEMANAMPHLEAALALIKPFAPDGATTS
jgi:hypothetical protein